MEFTNGTATLGSAGSVLRHEVSTAQGNGGEASHLAAQLRELTYFVEEMLNQMTPAQQLTVIERVCPSWGGVR